MGNLSWLWRHRAQIGAWILAGLAAWTMPATFLARLIARPTPDSAWWKRGLYDAFIDTPAWASALGHSGIFGAIFNLPSVPSRPPEQNPTPHESRMMRARLAMPSSFGPGEDTRHRRQMLGSLVWPLALAAVFAGILFAAGGCGTTGAAVGAALGSCELGSLPKELEGVLASVITAALSPAGVDWNAQLDQAAATVGPAQAQCVVQAAAAWFESMSKKGELIPAYAQAQRRLQAYLAKHAPTPAGGS